MGQGSAGGAPITLPAHLLERVLAQVTDAVVVTDAEMEVPGPRIRYVNPAFTRMTGWAPEDVLGRDPRMLQSPQTDGAALDALRGELLAGRPVRCELLNRRRDGSTFWVELDTTPLRDLDGVVTHFVSVQRDVSARKVDERLREESRHLDPITGLLNRQGFERELAALLAVPAGARAVPALMLCDVRGLRAINTSYGRWTGDEVLREVGRRLASLGGSARSARLDDGEFAVLLEDSTLTQLVTAGERLRRAMLSPVGLDDRELTVTVACGMASLAPGRTAAAVLREADLALRAAKARGGATYEFYEPEMGRQEHRQLELEQGLRTALARSELLLHQQPIVRIADGRLSGAESLLRWRRVGGALVSPVDFIPVAERSGLILPIGAWVLAEACRQAHAWQGRLPGVGVSVNLSPRQLSDRGLLEEVERALEVGLPPSLLTLEITEGALLEDPDAASRILQRLRQRGVCIALDDFGTGYSSLAYLARLPVHAIKIDKTFVNDVTTSSVSQAVVRAVVALARDVGDLRVVAEGVETRAQLGVLADLGCHDVQGFLFARPAPAAELSADVGRLSPEAPPVVHQ